jgi:pimeloyl-ACP methyl ester carboxylesterase
MYFGHQHGTEYSVLIVDNLGMGESDKPYMLSGYTTSGMAQDILEVADHIGWTAPRQLHVAGGSMGGMITQEIGFLAPERIASLLPWSTAAKIEHTGNFVDFLRQAGGLLVPKSLEKDIQDTAKGCLPQEWLEQSDQAKVPDGSIPKCRIPEGGYKRFETNYERWAAQEMVKSEKKHFTRQGFWMQALAAGKHNKRPEQLKEMADRIGRERIMVIHGDADKMMALELGKRLIQNLQPAKSVIVEGMGHVPMYERIEWFHALLEEHFRNGERLTRVIYLRPKHQLKHLEGLAFGIISLDIVIKYQLSCP